MKNYPIYVKECLVYPGEYAPLPERQEMLDELKLSCKDFAQPPVNIDEFEDFYKLEMVIPGVRREDIFIYTNSNNVLSVAVLYKKSTNGKKKLQVHEFDTKYLERRISLPDNADTEFVSAEYRGGILSLCIPKAGVPFNPVMQQIIVY